MEWSLKRRVEVDSDDEDDELVDSREEPPGEQGQEQKAPPKPPKVYPKWEARGGEPHTSVSWVMMPSRRRPAIDDATRQANLNDGLWRQRTSTDRVNTPWIPPPVMEGPVPSKLHKSYSDYLGASAPKDVKGRASARPRPLSAWDRGSSTMNLRQTGMSRETAIDHSIWCAGQAPRPNRKAVRLVPDPGTYLGPGQSRSIWSPIHGEFASSGSRKTSCLVSERSCSEMRFDVPHPPPYDVNQHVGPF